MQVYAARHVLPVASPPIVDGAVVVDGDRIVAVGPRDVVLNSDPGEGEIRELGDVAMMPGLVNAHTHVELSWLGNDPLPGDDYMTWLRALLDRRDTGQPQDAAGIAKQSIEGMVARGTVAVGDVGNATWVVPLLARSELAGVFFFEIYGLRSVALEKLLVESAAAMDALEQDPDLAASGDRWRIALTPHGPHTASTPLLKALAGRSAASNEPLSIHVAESNEEVSLLADGSGPLPDLFRKRAGWDEGWQAPGHSPVEQLDRAGALSPRTLAVHCVHLDRLDHSKLQSRGVSVITCPRSNRRLGVGTAPIPRIMREGIPVALGTDSLASAPDLDLFGEMSALIEVHPELKPAAVLRMATLNGATALGLDKRFGSIEAGKSARLVVVPLETAGASPLDAVCSNPDTVYPLERAPFETVPR